MLKMFVLVIILQTNGLTQSVTVVDNIATRAECQRLGENVAQLNGKNGPSTLNMQCLEVEKAR